ncbi:MULTISPECIES: hypothetical protein [unclassified Micromonospora]|uniref:hypothetical protein n=1 Tax=unclassified Micromonospora TaxID=2617518 RepID=UPI001B380D82|nr:MULTISPECIES: hypothetical protein [unclassified Micromonospora]MBQ0980166.1 hypothetical protein [Micromonospora sp. M61]MBQ1039446.1 hypothetical protein [Micromonospora sp. C81]
MPERYPLSGTFDKVPPVTGCRRPGRLGAETTDLTLFVPACAQMSGIPAEGVAATVEREILSQPDPRDFA